MLPRMGHSQRLWTTYGSILPPFHFLFMLSESTLSYFKTIAPWLCQVCLPPCLVARHSTEMAGLHSSFRPLSITAPQIQVPRSLGFGKNSQSQRNDDQFFHASVTLVLVLTETTFSHLTGMKPLGGSRGTLQTLGF